MARTLRLVTRHRKSVEQDGNLATQRCGWKHPHRFFGAMTPKEILLALAAPAVAGMVGLVVTFSGSDTRPAGSVQASVPSLNQSSNDDSGSRMGKDNPDR